MRAYQLWPHGPWIDLDHVLCIDPPQFVDRMGRGGYFVEMDLRMAFQDQPFTISRYQHQADYDPEREAPRPECTKNGWPTELHYMAHAVYTPLLKAWAGKEADIGSPIDYGYDKRLYAKR